VRLTSGPLHKDEYAADDYATTPSVASRWLDPARALRSQRLLLAAA